MLRHAIVSAAARNFLYGRKDVELCAESLELQREAYLALAKRLPAGAVWIVTPLSRTRHTAEAIFSAGYSAANLDVEPDLIEQDLGAWQGLSHGDLPSRLADPAHPFWPLGAGEIPPGGESMVQVLSRVGAAMERLATAHRGRDVVCISHGGAIRAAVAHALGASAESALHFSIQNLSLTVLERFSAGWRVVQVNEAGNRWLLCGLQAVVDRAASSDGAAE
jgi:broad specificity phosphatase PhoE